MEEREYFIGEREEKIGTQLQDEADLERNTYFATIQGAFAKLTMYGLNLPLHFSFKIVIRLYITW